MNRMHDVVILGATPAGYAAARYLAKEKRDVVVLELPQQGAQCTLADWVSADFFKLPGLPAGLARASSARAFRTVTFHGNDLHRSAEQVYKKTAGYFLPSGELTAALARSARKASAKIRSSETLPAIRVDEDFIEVIGTTHLAGRLLIFVQGEPHEALSDLALPVRTTMPSPLLAVALDCPLHRPLDAALHIVEMPERTELGIYFCDGRVLHLRVISTSVASLTRAAELSAMVAKLQRAGLLPTDLQLGRAKGGIWRPPAGMALELETHVAKRCLIAGTAGGFAESITGATLYTTVRSALLAAEVASKALDAKDVQVALMSFKNSWRKELEDRLRPPSTPFQMLLPLMFANKKVAVKLAKALLSGQGI